MLYSVATSCILLQRVYSVATSCIPLQRAALYGGVPAEAWQGSAASPRPAGSAASSAAPSGSPPSSAAARCNTAQHVATQLHNIGPAAIICNAVRHFVRAAHSRECRAGCQRRQPAERTCCSIAGFCIICCIICWTCVHVSCRVWRVGLCRSRVVSCALHVDHPLMRRERFIDPLRIYTCERPNTIVPTHAHMRVPCRTHQTSRSFAQPIAVTNR